MLCSKIEGYKMYFRNFDSKKFNAACAKHVTENDDV